MLIPVNEMNRCVFSVVTRGYWEKIQLLLYRSRLTYAVPITCSDALPLSYRKLVRARPGLRFV